MVKRIQIGSAIAIIAALLLLVLFGIWQLRDRAPVAVAVSDACNTFVSEFAPTRTPAFQAKAEHGELLVSFTPAKNEEADRIVKAVESGSKRLRIEPSGAELNVVGVKDGHLRLQVQNLQNAKLVLKQLCFDDKAVAALS